VIFVKDAGRRAQPASALPATVAHGASSKGASSTAAMRTDGEEPPFDKQAHVSRLTCQLRRALTSGTGYWTRKLAAGSLPFARWKRHLEILPRTARPL